MDEHFTNNNSLSSYWPLIHAIIQQLLAITEPAVEDAAIRNNIPFELYTYSEFGSNTFSTNEFQRRDPFTNPVLFEKIFVTLNFKGWIEPLPDDNYGVTARAHQAVRRIVQAGDAHLIRFESFTDIDLTRLVFLLKQIVHANTTAPEPPEKWAILHRFRLADSDSHKILQIKEYLMDLLAYRDDAHLSAAHPHYGRAGIVWIVLGMLCSRETVTAQQIAEILSFRGYEADKYEIALQAAVQIGWAQEASIPGTFFITDAGRELHASVERLTDEYFFAPWSFLTPEELDELRDLLLKLRDQLNSFQRAQ